MAMVATIPFRLRRTESVAEEAEFIHGADVQCCGRCPVLRCWSAVVGGEDFRGHGWSASLDS